MNDFTRSVVATVGTMVVVSWLANRVRRQVAPQLPPLLTTVVVSAVVGAATPVISRAMTRLAGEL